jgi:hypothetical protein
MYNTKGQRERDEVVFTSLRFISSAVCILSHGFSALKGLSLDNIYFQDTIHHQYPDN